MAKRQIDRIERPVGPWNERVDYAEQGLFAFRPRQLIVEVEQVEQVVARLEKTTGDEVKAAQIAEGEFLVTSAADFDVAAFVTALAADGVTAEPNVVYFNHSCCGGGGCAGGLGSNPFNSNPFNSNPFNSNPFNSNPFNSNPFNSNGFAASGQRPSSARPADSPGKTNYLVPAGAARVIILDTGIAQKTMIPTLLNQATHINAAKHDRDIPDARVMDTFLDPSSGHGTFIAGIIEQLAPGHEVRCIGVLNTLGEGDAAILVNRIDELLAAGLIDKNTIVNMSFGSYGDLGLSAVGRAVRRIQDKGAVVVASAGNDDTCLPSYPAAFPEVVSVGAIEPGGRAPYSNYGPWVRACAPGTDLVSSFFKRFDGDISAETAVEDFRSWAQWTGTSFSGPVVAAALVRHMDLTGESAKDAVAAVVDGPSLGRYPGLGTVVNLAPGQ